MLDVACSSKEPKKSKVLEKILEKESAKRKALYEAALKQGKDLGHCEDKYKAPADVYQQKLRARYDKEQEEQEEDSSVVII